MADTAQHITKAQLNVLRKLRDGWTLDRWGRHGMRGIMCRRKGEDAVVSQKTMNFLIAEELIGVSIGGIQDFELTKTGAALAK